MRSSPRMPSVDSGIALCLRCCHCRPVGNARGSVFLRCEWADVDPSYARYPRLPVLECGAYAPQEEGPAFDTRPISGKR